jgi:hypothetical protein
MYAIVIDTAMQENSDGRPLFKEDLSLWSYDIMTSKLANHVYNYWNMIFVSETLLHNYMFSYSIW